MLLLAAFAPLSSKLNSQKVDTSTSLLPELGVGPGGEELAKRFAGGDKQATVLLYHRAGGLTAADRRGSWRTPRRRQGSR